jgi:hypothetical protein
MFLSAAKQQPMELTTDYPERQSRNHREDGGWKSREKSQGNVCQGNNPENAFSHSLDNHSPDFAFDNVFNRMGALKILAKMERNRVCRKSCRKCAIFHYSGTDYTDGKNSAFPTPNSAIKSSV